MNTTYTIHQVYDALADEGYHADDINAAVNSFIDAETSDMDEAGWTDEDIAVLRVQLDSYEDFDDVAAYGDYDITADGAWTCSGPVRGECGVNHRTHDAAERHCAKDRRDVKRGHGGAAYSDRRPVPVGQ